MSLPHHQIFRELTRVLHEAHIPHANIHAHAAEKCVEVVSYTQTYEESSVPWGQ